MAFTSPPQPGRATVDRDEFIAPRLFGHADQNLIRGAVPAIIQAGTVAANGTVTLAQALPFTFANAWLWLPAGAIVGGAAGWYFARFTSTTVGQVFDEYRNPAAGFIPSTPFRALYLAVGSGSAYAIPAATNIPVLSVAVAGNSFGNNGGFELEVEITALANANSKTVGINLGATNIYNSAALIGTGTGARGKFRGLHRGVPNTMRFTSPAIGAGSVGIQTGVIDTTVSQQLVVNLQMAVATDYLILEMFDLTMLSES
jgi:hypothetical protein